MWTIGYIFELTNVGLCPIISWAVRDVTANPLTPPIAADVYVDTVTMELKINTDNQINHGYDDTVFRIIAATSYSFIQTQDVTIKVKLNCDTRTIVAN